jgi:hypothetical protein
MKLIKMKVNIEVYLDNEYLSVCIKMLVFYEVRNTTFRLSIKTYININNINNYIDIKIKA